MYAHTNAGCTRGRVQSWKQLEAGFTCPQLRFTFSVSVKAQGEGAGGRTIAKRGYFILLP